MPLIRKRRADPALEPQSESDDASAHDTPPKQENDARRQRRRTEASPSDAESSADSSSESSETHAPSSTDVMVKKLVRLALSSEYSRLPIRRTDISTKVLGEQGSRQFKAVFEAAQNALRSKFGMEMTELPGREKVTIHQRRAAQRVEKPSSNSNKSWILTSTLPAAYRKTEILPPTRAPMEGAYTGLYTFIIALILLNGGSLPEQKLDRYLQRTNTDTYTPIDRTDRFLQRLCKEGYLVRNREMDSGEEVIEYMVGPRGKIEVGAQGVAGLAREVYGRQAAVEDKDMTAAEREISNEFELRLARSLGITKREAPRTEEGEASDAGDADGDERRPQRQTRQQTESDED
ncbi:MAGE family-domain-containing protein [Aspergillus ambiguus]|uniref:MAGE domain-containing protein n=1 Tax=Aspergillus ambiguus TaxID=176160 RepID=UPI003CCD2B6E